MKKFTKISLSIAGIMMVLGLIFGAVALTMGVTWKAFTGGLMNVGIDSDGWHFDIGDVDFVGYAELPGGNESCTDVCELSAIKGISVDTDRADIIFEKSDMVDQVAVTMLNGYMKYYSYSVDGSILNVKYDCDDVQIKKGATFKITVPTNIELDEIIVDTAMGDVEFQNLTIGADTFDVSTSMGDVIFEDMTVTSDLDANTDMGDVKIKSGSFKNVKMSTSMGSVEAEATFAGDVSGYSSMGDVEVTINGNSNDYNYDLETSMGDVSIDGKKEKSDFGGAYATENNGGKYDVELESSMGDVSLRFH